MIALLRQVIVPGSVLACLAANPAWAQTVAATALPTGAVVNSGSVSTSTAGAVMSINQTSAKASINWQSFNIGSGATVNIAQPNAKAVLLNRVVGNDPSQIFGKLTANGQVILINPNGVVFGKGGAVTASAFTASTFGMTDADFANGTYKFTRNGSTKGVSVEDGASITTTTPGGYVALISTQVNNQGALSANQGAVVLAAGESATLPSSLANSVGVPLSGKVSLVLSPAAVDAHISNGGIIASTDGQVLMQTAAVMDAVAHVTNGNIDLAGNVSGKNVSLISGQGSIQQTAGQIKSDNLELYAGTTIGSSTQRIQADTRLLSMNSAGSQYATLAHGVGLAAQTRNNGSIDVQTLNGTLTVGGVNGISGITANGTGNITLSANAPTGDGMMIYHAITALNGTVTLNGTTAANYRNGDAFAGVHNWNVVRGKNIVLNAHATNNQADVLGYYGGAGSLVASNTLVANASSAGSGVGFYMWSGLTQAANGMTINGTSNTGPGIALTNNATVNNTTSGNVVMTSAAQVTAAGFSGATVQNNGGGISISATQGNINGSALQITQNANADVTLTTLGNGNIILPNILNQGTGRVVLAAGIDLARGNSSGGSLLVAMPKPNTNANTVIQKSGGQTLVFTGTKASAWALTNLATTLPVPHDNSAYADLNNTRSTGLQLFVREAPPAPAVAPAIPATTNVNYSVVALRPAMAMTGLTASPRQSPWALASQTEVCTADNLQTCVCEPLVDPRLRHVDICYNTKTIAAL